MIPGEEEEEGVNTENQNDAGGEVRQGEAAVQQEGAQPEETREGAAQAGGYDTARTSVAPPFEQELKPAAGQHPDLEEGEEQPRNSTLDEAEGEDKDGNDVDSDGGDTTDGNTAE